MQVSSAMEEQDGEMVVKRLSVPVGLEELMTGLTREVLQKKPKDLYTFASEHFGQLLALRDNGNYRNPPSRSFAFYDQDDMENRTPNGNLRKSRSGGGSGRQLSRQVSIRAESPVRKSRIRRSGTPKHDDNNNSESKTKAKQDKSKPARRQTPGSKSKFDNLEPVNEDALKVVAKKENLSKRSTDKKSKDSSGSKGSKRSSFEESERLKKKGENFGETKGKSKTKRNEAGEDSAKFVPKSSSVEEATTGIKDGRLTVTPPKIIKEAQSPTDQLDLPTTLVVPVLTAASSCLSVDVGKKEGGQDEDIRKALKNDSETGEILSVSKEDSQDSSSKNYDSSTLKEELKKVEEEAKLNNFTTSYNPYKLRQEIKNASKEGDDHENIDALGTESAAGETQSPHVNLTPNLQHSGELHDTIVPQEGSAEDSTDDQKVLEDKEELNSKELKKIAHIGLQHSGELHDSLIPKENETVKEGESMEAIKTPIQLQHSSELHDTAISKEIENINGESQEKVETPLGLQQEKVTVKEDKPIEAIKTPIQLQHSSELHDTVISKETENINGESQEKVETPLALQHSGKLHEAVIPEDIITEDEKDTKIHNVQVSESPTASPEKETSVAESTFASAAAAATKIQSLWRGFRVRKIGKAKVHELVDQHNVPESENRRSLSDDNIMQAATKIQAGVRGYLTRKQQKNKISATKANASADEELQKALSQLDNAPIPNESPELARRKRETPMDISDNAVVKADDREENSTVTDKLSKSKSVRGLGSGKLSVPAFSKSFSVTDSAISKTLDDDEEKLRSLTEDTESLGEQTEDLGIGSEMSFTQQVDQGKITEEVLSDISQITENKKIVEEPPFVTDILSPLHHSGELHDTVVHKESKQIDDSSVIPPGGESIQELPSKILQSDILKEQMTPKQLPELASTSDLQHSGELHDLLIPKETDITDQDPQKANLSSPPLQHSGEIHDRLIPKETNITDQDPQKDNLPPPPLQHSGEIHDLLIPKETNVTDQDSQKANLSSPPLQHSGKIHDTVIMNKSYEQGSVVDDNQLAEIESQVEEPHDISTTNENKQTSEEEFLSLIGLQHSGELRDIVMPKKKEIGSSGNYNGLAIPQLSSEQGDKSIVNESDIAEEDTVSPPYTLHHSSELYDSVISMKVEENKDVQADTSLITPNPEIPKESPETKGKNDSESLPLEHGSKLYEAVTSKENEENKDIEADAGFIATSPQLAVESPDISKIKDPETNAKDSSKSVSLEHSSELHDAVILKGSEKNKTIQAHTGLIAGSQQLAEESPDTSKIKETETHAKCSSELLSLKHSSEFHDAVIPKESEEHKVIQADTGFITASPQLAVESPDTLNENEENKEIQENVDLIAASLHLSEDTLKIKQTETNAKDNPESIFLEHSSELRDTAIPKVSEENKDIQVDTSLIAASPHLTEESATETNIKDTSKSAALEHSSELHDVITPKGSKENKDIQADTDLVAASPHLDEESPDTSQIKETEPNGKDSSESTSLEHSSELHDAVIAKPCEENKDIQADTGLLAASPEIAKESPDTSQMKIVTSNENEEIQQDVGLIAAKPHFSEKTPDISIIENTETKAKVTSEPPSFEHSSKLQDAVTSKESEKNKNIEADTDLIAVSPHLVEESPVTSKIMKAETNKKYAFESTSLEHSSELHDAITPKGSEENKDIQADIGLLAARSEIAKKPAEMKAITSNGNEENKEIQQDVGLIAVNPHLAEQTPDISKIEKTETNAKDAFESTSLEHSSDLRDAVTPKESEKNKNIKAGTDLIAASPHLAKESPVTSKINDTETNAKDSFESTSLEHSSELHDVVTSKESEKNKNIEAGTDLIAASPHLAEESPVTSKIKTTETNAKDSLEPTSLEHSSELHDAVTPKQSEKNRNIEADTDLIAASPHLAKELPVTSKIMETETNAKDSFKSTSLEHSSELRDAVTPKENEKNKNTEADTNAASPHLAEESPVTSKIMETETNVKDTFKSTSLEHSSELHDTVSPKENEENKDIQADTGLIAASPQLSEESPNTSKIKETETNVKGSPESVSLEHSSELHDTAIPTASIAEETKNNTEDMLVPTTFQNDTVIPNDLKQDKSLVISSPLLAEENKNEKINSENNTAPVAIEHTSELTNDLVPITVKEEKAAQESQKLSMQSLPHGEELQDTVILNKTEKDSEKGSCKDTVTPNKIKESENSNDQDSSTPVAIQNGSGMTKILAASTIDEVEKVSEEGSPTSITLQHSSELHDPVISNETEEKGSLKMPRPALTEVKEIEKTVAVQHNSEVANTLIPDTIEKQNVIQERELLLVPSPQSTEKSDDTARAKENDQNREEDTPKSVFLEHSSELHDTMLTEGVKEEKIVSEDKSLITASPLLIDKSNDSLAINKMAKTSEEDSSKSSVLQNSSESYDSAIPDLVEKEKITQEDKSLVAARPQFSKETHGSLTTNNTDNAGDNYESTTLQHSSELHDAVIPNDANKDKTLMITDLQPAAIGQTEEISEDVPTIALQHSSEVRAAVVAKEAAVSTIASLQLTEEPHDVSKTEEIDQTDEEGKSTLSTSRHRSSELHNSKILNEVKQAESGNMLETPQSNNELGDASEEKAIKSDGKDDNDSEIDVVIADSTDENKYVKTTEETEEKHKQSPATTLPYDDVLSNDTKKHQTSEDDKHVASAIPLPTEGMHNTFDKNSMDKPSINHESLKTSDMEQYDALLNNNKHQEEIFENDDDLAMKSPQLNNQPLDIDTAKESGKTYEMDQSSLTMLQHSSELHDTLMPIAIDKETLKDNTKLITEDPKTTDDDLTENVIDKSDKKDKSSQPRTNELNNAALSNVSLEEPLASNKSVPTITPQLVENLQDSLEVKKSDLSPSALSHSSEMHDTVIPETVDNTLQKRSDDLKVEESQTAKMHQKGDNRSVVPSPIADKVDDILVTKESDQNEEANLSKGVETSKTSQQQNNTLEDDVYLPASIGGDVLIDVEQQKQIDETPKQENMKIAPLQHSSELHDVLITQDIENKNDLSQTHQHLQSHNLMSKDQDKEIDVNSKEKVDEMYEESHLSLLAADPHGDEHGLIISIKEDPDDSTRKKIDESKQTSGDRKSTSNDATRQSGNLEHNVEQQDLESKKESHVDHEKGEDIKAILHTQAYSGKDDDSLSQKEAVFENSDLANFIDNKSIASAGLIQVDKQEPTNSITAVPDLNEPTNVQHSGEIHDSIFPPGDVNNKSNIDNNHVLGTKKLQSEKDGEGHQSPEHDNESSEAPPTSGLQHSGEFHDLLIPQPDNSKQEEVRNSVVAVTSLEDTFENKISVDVTKPNEDLITETQNVGEQTGENSIKLQEEGSAVKDSEDGGQSADGSKTLAAQNQVQNVEVGKDDSNGHDFILNKQISSSVLDVLLECEAPASSTATASGALSDDVQRDNYNLHHKTDEPANGQPIENLNSLSPIQDPHSRNTENRKEALHNLDVDIQQPKQSSTELTKEDLLSPHENIDTEEDRNKLDSEEKEVKEILKNSASSTHIIGVKGNDVNDVNNKNIENKNHDNEELHSKTEEFEKNLNKEFEPLAKQGGYISSDFDMTALRAELTSVESQIENVTNGLSTDNIEGEDNTLKEPVSSKTFDIAQLHSEIENIVATQPDEDKQEITESDISKNNVILENAPTPKKGNRDELNSITRIIDGQKDALSEITQAKASDNSLPNEDSTAENKSKELGTDVLSNGDTHSKIEDKHEEKAVSTNLTSVADKATLPNIENAKQNDISLEGMKGNTFADDIPGRLRPLVNEELEEKELEKISTEVKDVLKDINDHRKISDTKALNDDGKKVDDGITEDKQSSKIARNEQQSSSNTEENEKDSKRSTGDTLANGIIDGVTKQEIAELPLQNINSGDKESMETENAENILTSRKEGPEGKIEENLIKDDNASKTFDMSKLRAELEQASNVLQSEANLKENTAVEDVRNQQNQVQNKIKETAKKLSVEDDKTESSKGVVDNAISLKTSADNDDSITGKKNLEKTLIPNISNPSTFEISTLRSELEEIEKQIETGENETNTTDHKSEAISTSTVFDISKLRSELEKLETDENEDKGTISNDIDKLNKTNENDLNEIQETANTLSQDKTKKSVSEGSANVSKSSHLSSPPHAVESKSEKASTNESLAIDYESAPTRPATSDITPSISLNENIQIPSDNVYKHAEATDLEPHNSAEIITSGSFKGEGNDEKSDLGPATTKKQNVDVHINDKINEANFKDSMLKSFSVAELNPKDQLDNATKDKLKLEEEIERPVSISSTTSTDSVGTVIFNSSSPREIDEDAESHFEMPQGNESQKSKDNTSNLDFEEAKQHERVNTADDRHNHHEVVPDKNTLQSQAINELNADDVQENNANSKDIKLINRSPVIPVEVTPGKVNAFDKGIENNVEGRMSDLEEKIDGLDGSNGSAVTASENNAISGKAAVSQEATSTKDLNTNKTNVSTSIEPTCIEDSNGYTAQKLDNNKVNSIKIPQSNLQKEASNEDQDVAHALQQLVTPKKSEVKTIDSTVIANVEKEDNSNIKHMITNNLDVFQSVESNEKSQEKEIVQKSEDTFKESNNLQEVETHKDSQMKTNEDTITSENTIQTRIKEPEISRSKLPHVETSPTDFTKRNDEDAEVLANNEPIEKNKASEIQNFDEELILQNIETTKGSEVNANERNIHNISQLTKQDGLNSKIVDKNKEAKKPENTLSKLAPDETTPSDVKNKKFEVKESVADHQETIKENNKLHEIAASKGSEAYASDGNINTENNFQITKQDESVNKNELTEKPEIASSKLAIVGTSPAKIKNKDNNEAITSNLHDEQNIEPNEKDDVKEIIRESNNMQESETNRRPGEANESNRTTDNVLQITKQDEMSAEIINKNKLQEEPKITLSKLLHVETSLVNVTNKNDKDVVIPNFDVAQKIEPNEKVEVKEIVLSPEEIPKQTNDLQKIETKQISEVKAKEDDITNADASQTTKQNEMNVEPASKKKLTEVSEITSPKLEHVQTSAPDIKHKKNKDIVTPNLDAVEKIEGNEKVDFAEIAPNAEETLKEAMKLQEIKVNKCPEAKPDEDDSTETVPQITTQDEISSEIVSKKELKEEPKITSSKLLHVETSPVDVQNKDDEDIVRPNLDAAENIATSGKVDVNELAPNAEETSKKNNHLQELKVEKSSEVKTNEGNIITETAPQITTQDDMNSESISNNKPTEEPKITSSKSVLVETSPADIKNKHDKDIPTPNLNVAKNIEVNKNVNMKEIASNPEETLKEFNNLQEIEATRSLEVTPNEDNTTTATAPQITTLDEITAEIVNKHKPTEEPKITSSKLTLVETPPAGVKNNDDKDISTPNLDVAENIEANKNVDTTEIASNPEKTLKEANNLQKIEANKIPAVKANEDNVITESAPQIITQDEIKVESKNKLTEKPQITSSKLTLVEEFPDLKNEDDKDIVTPNLSTAKNTEQNKKTKVKEIGLSPEKNLKETNDPQEIKAKNSSKVNANEDNIIIGNASQITTQDDINSENVRNNTSIEEPKITSAKLSFVEASPADLKNKDGKDIVTPNLDANKKFEIKENVPNLEGTNIVQEITANNSPELKANKDNIIIANVSPIATQDGMNSESGRNNNLTEDPTSTSDRLTFVEASPVDLKNKDDKDIIPNLDANEKVDIKEIVPNLEETVEGTNIEQDIKANKSLEVKANKDNIITANDSPIDTQDQINSESVSNNKTIKEPKMTSAKLIFVEASPTDLKNKNDEVIVTPALKVVNEKVHINEIGPNSEESLKETNNLQESKARTSLEVEANEDNIITDNDSPITKEDEMNSESVSKNELKEKPEITLSTLTLVTTSPTDVKNKGDKDNFIPNLDAAENFEANEKVDVKAIAPNPEEANKSAEVKTNEDNTIIESDSAITKQDEMNNKIVSKNEVKEEPEITSSKLAVVGTSPVDIKNKDDQHIFSLNLGIAENIEPKEKVKPKEIVPNVEKSLQFNNLQEIEENKSSEIKANEDHTITENTSQINKHDEMNELEEKPENISSKSAGIETSPADLKNYDKDMITPNSQFTEENKMNYGIVSKNEQEEEPHITSAKSVPVETSFPDVRNDNDHLDVAQKHEPHGEAGVKETVSNAKEIINTNKETFEAVKNNEEEKDIEKKGDKDAITTDLNVAEHIELNQKPEIKKVVQDPEKSNNLQVVETNKYTNIITNEESTTAGSIPHFTIKEDVNTVVTSKDKQEETPKTTSFDLALAETLYSDSRKEDEKDIKDNIANNINKAFESNERKEIVEETEPIREIPLEIKTESIDKSTDMKLQEKFLKSTQEAEPSDKHKTILEAAAIKEVASKENNHEMGKTTKGQVTGINDEDLPVEEQDLVQDKKSDQNRLDNSVTLLQEQGAHLNQHEAATKIQSGYRGYRVRRSLTMPLLETSSSKISNDSDEVDEHIKNTLLRHVEYDNNKTIKEAEMHSKLDLSPDIITKFLNTDKNLIQNATAAAADLDNHKNTIITPGDPKQSEDIRSTSPPTALMNIEDEDGSYDPFKHASAPPLSLLDHEEEFDLHNQSMLESHPPEENNQTTKTISLDELPKPSDSKEKQTTAVDKIMDVASAHTHILTSKPILDNKLSPGAESNNAGPSQKAKKEDVHVLAVEQPEGVSPRFHNDKDRPVTQALEIVLDQQLALATPSAVKKEESVESEGPEYIYIPLKDPKVSSPSKILSEGLQHSGEYHDSVVPLLTNAPPKDTNIDATSLGEPKEEKIDDEHAISSDSIIEEDDDSSKYDLVDNHKSPRTQIENEGAVTKALGSVLDQQLAITTPKAKPKEEESSEEPKYIYIPLKDPNQESSFEEKDFTETKHEKGVSEQESDKPVLVPASHYEAIPQMATKIDVHNKDSDINNVEKQQDKLLLTKTIDVTPNTSSLKEARPDTESKIVSPMQQIQTKTDVNKEGFPVSVYSSVVKEDESHSSLAQSFGAPPKTSPSKEAQPLSESKTEVLTKSGEFGQALGATALVLSSNLADATSSPVVITRQPSATRSGSADIRATIPPGTPTFGLQVRFSPSPTQNVEEISASVSPIGERREGSHSTQEDRSVQSDSPPLVIQTTQISDVLPVAVQLNQPPAGAAVLTSPTRSDAGASVTAHAPSGGASTKDGAPGGGAHFQLSMETGNRTEASTNGENMEELAATKIQASFRGYQVRKQLKCKNGGVESLRRSLRRKSSGKLRGSDKASQKAPKNADLEEKSATKIQAGVRGFLVRRRQKKAKGNSSPESS